VLDLGLHEECAIAPSCRCNKKAHVVPVVLAVRLVVLLVVGYQIREREAVVRGDEVDAGAGLPPALPFTPACVLPPVALTCRLPACQRLPVLR